MNEKLLRQAMNLFDTQEKWDAFVELSSNRDEIRNRWTRVLIDEIQRLFYNIAGCSKWDIDNGKWYIQVTAKQFVDFSQLVVYVDFPVQRTFLWINAEEYDSDKAVDEMRNNKQLMQLLESYSYLYEHHIWNKQFSDIINLGTWYQSSYQYGHNTKEVAKYIFENYLQPFLTDEIADLFVDICEKTNLKNKKKKEKK